MKNLAITLDGVIRNTFDQFDTFYRKKFIKNPSLVGMNDQYEFIDEQESEAESKRLETIVNQKIHLPISTYNLRNHYEFENEKEFHKFLYEDYVLQIFGMAGQVPFAMEKANKIQNFGETLKLFKTTLICSGEHQVVNSTFRFLNAQSCKIKNIIFCNDPDDLKNKFDVIITDNPLILELKDEKQKMVKVKALYNSSLLSDMEVDTLTAIDENELKKLFNSSN